MVEPLSAAPLHWGEFEFGNTTRMEVSLSLARPDCLRISDYFMSLITRVKNRTLRWSLPPPFDCRHIEYSVVASMDDEPARPTKRLLDVALDAVSNARHLDLSWLSKRMARPPFYPEVWPGEHYKLLSALVLVLKPRRIIEIGTAQGLGALSLKSSLPTGSEIITIDLIPWSNFKDSVLLASDFQDQNLRQVLGDLSDRAFFEKFAGTLSGCDFLFVDAPKNLLFERTLVESLSTITMPPNALVVFDDIRHWNMLKIWRDIRKPKLDLTSFGHWTGTGLVDWNG